MHKEINIRKIHLVFILTIFLYPLQIFSQDISGVWIGHLYNDTTRQNIPYELAINEQNGKETGYSHITFVVDSVKNIGVKSMKIKINDGQIYIIDNKFIYNNYSIPPPEGVKMFATLTLSQNDTATVLSGTWGTNATKDYNPLTGTVFLERKRNENPRETEIVAKLIQLGLENNLSFLPPSVASKEMLTINNKRDTPKKDLQSPVAQSKTIEEIKPKEKAKSIKEETPIIPKAKNENAIVLKEEPKNGAERKPVINSAKISTQKNIPPAVASSKINEEIKTEKKHEPIILAKENKQKTNELTKPNPVINNKTNPPEKKTSPTVVSKTVKEEPSITPKEPAKNAIVLKEEPQKENILKPLSVVKNEIPVDLSAAADLSTRKIETIRTVDITQDSLVLSLYDNGTVDGDTVSVLLNGKVIMPRVGLLARAINKTIYLTPEMGDSISVIMYAENLGSIPPNTGLLVIREAHRIYEIRFSGDLNKNSKIILIRKKNE